MSGRASSERDPRADAYAREKGEEALARHLRDAEGRCDTCWARDGQPHFPLCPNRLPDEDTAPPTQEASLF